MGYDSACPRFGSQVRNLRHVHAIAVFEREIHVLRHVWCLFGRDAEFVHGARVGSARIKPWVLQLPAFKTDVQKIAVHRVRFCRARRHRNIVGLGECNHFRASGKLFSKTFLPPWRDDAQLRPERGRREFEANLIIPLPGCAVRDGVGSLGARNFDHSLGNEWTRDAGPEKILSFVNRARLKHRENKIPGEFVAQIFDDALHRARLLRFLLQSFELLFLADIGAESDYFGLIIFFEPAKNDGRVQPARVRENDFHFIAPRPQKITTILDESQNLFCPL